MTPEFLLELSDLFMRECDLAAAGAGPRFFKVGPGTFIKSTFEGGSPIDEEEANRLGEIVVELRERAGKAAA